MMSLQGCESPWMSTLSGDAARLAALLGNGLLVQPKMQSNARRSITDPSVIIGMEALAPARAVSAM
jgi:hypothetical protein